MTVSSCERQDKSPDFKMIFLHHSTGFNIWSGNQSSLNRRIGKVIGKITGRYKVRTGVPLLLEKYNKINYTAYSLEERAFPAAEPYGWHNYPYDYYNIWVRNAGNSPYQEEPTLEILTKEYQVVIFKHCFPVSNIMPDKDTADIDSDYKSLRNYKLQYLALREKLHQFPDTKFIVWTGAVQVKSQISEQEAVRSKEFFEWVIKTWDIPDDNIYIWDFYGLQTEGQLYFQEKYASSETDSHPNKTFSGIASGLFFARLMDIVISKGKHTTLKGEPI
jgi:hypothetical protein